MRGKEEEKAALDMPCYVTEMVLNSYYNILTDDGELTTEFKDY